MEGVQGRWVRSDGCDSQPFHRLACATLIDALLPCDRDVSLLQMRALMQRDDAGT